MTTVTGTSIPPVRPAWLRAGDWFVDSGIQHACGGVARYHWIAERRNAPVSSEITGYAVAALLELHERTGDGRYLAAARRAGDFLCRAWDPACEAMPFEWSDGQAPGERLSYFFDNGIIARGLLRLWRATGIHAYLETARRCADSMARDFLNGRDIHPVLRLPSKEPLERDAGRWSRCGGCYQLKSALAWRELDALLGEARYQDAFDRAFSLTLADHDSFLDAAPGDSARMDRLHAYCYFLEALLGRPDDDRARDALAAGIARTGAELRRIRAGFERSDVNAQLLRVRLWADRLGLVALDEEAAAEEAQRVASFQMSSAEARLNGCFNFARHHGELSNFANPVSTAFCLQALAMWEEHRHGGLRTGWDSLI
ncbi:MAG: hypothetical protein ACPL7M_07135 [Bryobacteraceae bacterium]